jgi:acetyl-CoA carboxylase biotin carboxyl carrier protein
MVFPSIALIEQIIELFNKSGASELEFSDEFLKFRIRRSAAVAPTATVGTAVAISPSVVAPPRMTASPASDLPVTSFMHGVFHHAPAPDQAPFVTIGAAVVKDQQIGILEAMKVFMPVVAPMNGVVAVIHVENGIEVAARQPLVTISSTLLPGAVS